MKQDMPSNSAARRHAKVASLSRSDARFWLLAGAAFFLIAAISLLFPFRAHAVTMVYADIEAMTQDSSWVVDGVIVDSETFIGDHGRITTKWRVAVMETIHGDEVSEIFIEQWAGTYDGITAHIPGDARLSLGERSIFFLSGDSPDRLFLTAMGQARFVIQAPMPGEGGGPVVEVGDFLVGPSGLRNALLNVDLDGVSVERDLSDISFYDVSREVPLYRVDNPEVLRRSQLVERVQRAAGEAQ